ncbi:hypothetical protein [Eubacterium sp. An3]|nr:hypothetical protein [Eubacterium sp. An3]
MAYQKFGIASEFQFLFAYDSNFFGYHALPHYFTDMYYCKLYLYVSPVLP